MGAGCSRDGPWQVRGARLWTLSLWRPSVPRNSRWFGWMRWDEMDVARWAIDGFPLASGCTAANRAFPATFSSDSGAPILRYRRLHTGGRATLYRPRAAASAAAKLAGFSVCKGVCRTAFESERLFPPRHGSNAHTNFKKNSQKELYPAWIVCNLL